MGTVVADHAPRPDGRDGQGWGCGEARVRGDDEDAEDRCRQDRSGSARERVCISLHDMKAILHSQYGSPDLLQFMEVDKPAPRDNEVLIAIHATTVSTGDCNIRNLTFVTKSMRPIARLMFGIGKPWKARILGTELAGEVEGT